MTFEQSLKLRSQLDALINLSQPYSRMAEISAQLVPSAMSSIVEMQSNILRSFDSVNQIAALRESLLNIVYVPTQTATEMIQTTLLPMQNFTAQLIKMQSTFSQASLLSEWEPSDELMDSIHATAASVPEGFTGPDRVSMLEQFRTASKEFIKAHRKLLIDILVQVLAALAMHFIMQALPDEQIELQKQENTLLAEQNELQREENLLTQQGNELAQSQLNISQDQLDMLLNIAEIIDELQCSFQADTPTAESPSEEDQVASKKDVCD